MRPESEVLLRVSARVDAPQWGKLNEIAQFLAEVQGITARQALFDLATGIDRHSYLILDNIGIMIRVAQLPGYESYQRAWRQYFGRGWLGRLWCRTVRPALFPGRQRQLDEAFSEAQLRLHGDLINAVIEQGEALRA